MIDTIILDVSLLSFLGFVVTWLTLQVGTSEASATTAHETGTAAAAS